MHHICSPIEICNSDTRDDAKNHRGARAISIKVILARSSKLFSDRLPPLGGLLFEDFSHSSSAIQE